MPEIAHPEQQDRVSAKGFSYGYTGSVILLIINLALLLSSESQAEANKAMQWSFVMVGIWWAGFAQITFLKLHETPTGNPMDGSVLKKGYKELGRVWQDLKFNPTLKKFLSGFFVYNMAVQTVMLLATTFALTEVKQIGKNGEIEAMGSDKLIISILIW